MYLKTVTLTLTFNVKLAFKLHGSLSVKLTNLNLTIKPYLIPLKYQKALFDQDQCFCGVILQDHETNLGPERALNDIRQRVYADVYFINYS